MFMGIAADSARPLTPGRLSLGVAMDYTSVFVNERKGDWEAVVDMEMTALDVTLAYGFTERLSVSVSIPFVSMNSGVLDPFLEVLHSTLGLPNYGRKERPQDEFAYHILENGKAWFTGRSGGSHVTDSTVSAKLSLYGEKQTDTVTGSLLFRLKLPTGNAEHGFGSGGFDQGVFFLSRFLLDPLALYINPGIMHLSKPDVPGLSVPTDETIWGVLLCGEYYLNRSWSLLTQLSYYTSPFEDIGIPHFDGQSLQLALGLTYGPTPGTYLEFSLSEDLSRAAPDFTVHARVAFDWDL